MPTRARATWLAILSAVLFGASTPLSKVLLGDLGGSTLAGLLYLGAAVAVAPAVVARLRSGAAILPSDATNRWRLFGAVALGGGLGPVLVLAALARAPAASVSLWLNLETLATAVLGVLLFREHLGRLAIVANLGVLAAGMLLAFDGGRIDPVPALLVAGGAFCWGIDNHLSALIVGIRPEESTFFKGLGAGTVNLLLGWWGGGALPAGAVAGALAVGAVSYGASIVLYITAAQGLGATRAQMIFAAAPFVGVAGSVLLGEPLGAWQAGAGLLLLGANALLALERHEHEHDHPDETHEHPHRHDDGHHDHVHEGLPVSAWHTHAHEHLGHTHSHRHLPDLHHRHRHS